MTLRLMTCAILFVLVLSIPGLFAAGTAQADAPVYFIQEPDPQYAPPVMEGGDQNFTITIKFVDGDWPGWSNWSLFFYWSIDYVLIAKDFKNSTLTIYPDTHKYKLEINDTFSYSPDFESAGEHIISVRIDDEQGSYDSYYTYNWSVHVDNTNRRPIARITTPQNNSQVDQGKLAYFIAEADDVDGDSVEMNWYENGKLIHQNHFNNGSGLDSWSKRLKSGSTNIIMLQVNDTGGLTNTYYRTIVVYRETPPPPFYYRLCGYSCILFLSLSVSIVAIIKKGRTRPIH
jgi:hypothetical protein